MRRPGGSTPVPQRRWCGSSTNRTHWWAAAVAKETDKIAAAVDLIYERFRAGGRLHLSGCGDIGRLGVLDASECVPTFGVDPEWCRATSREATLRCVTRGEGCEDRKRTASAWRRS